MTNKIEDKKALRILFWNIFVRSWNTRNKRKFQKFNVNLICN